MMSVIDQEERGVSISVYGMADERGHGAFFDASLTVPSYLMMELLDKLTAIVHARAGVTPSVVAAEED